MKKIILLSAIGMATFGMSAKAQLILGVKGGANFSKINTENVKESTLTGYQAGLFVRAGRGFYFQPEVYVSSTGGKFIFQNNSGAAYEEAKVRFTNLNVPLLLGQSFGTNSLNFRIMAGPIYTAILDKNRNFSQTAEATYKDIGDYKKGTLGFQAGAGIDFGPLTLDGRYEGGLTKISNNYGQRQNLIAVSLGFKLL